MSMYRGFYSRDRRVGYRALHCMNNGREFVGSLCDCLVIRICIRLVDSSIDRIRRCGFGE